MHQVMRSELDAQYMEHIAHVAEMAKVARLETAVREGLRELKDAIPQPPVKRMVAKGDRYGITAHHFGTFNPEDLHDYLPGAMGRPE
jgi:hypothetical protein